MKGDHLGELEELVLLAVHALDEAYGVTVQQAIEQIAGRPVTLGAVYSALERLERKDLLRSRMGSSSGTQGGRRKRLFEITGRGRATVEEARGAREALWHLAEAEDV